MLRYDLTDEAGCPANWHLAPQDGDWVPYEVANELLQALKDLREVVTKANCDGMDWKSQFGPLMSALGTSAKAIWKAEGLDDPKD